MYCKLHKTLLTDFTPVNGFAFLIAPLPEIFIVGSRAFSPRNTTTFRLNRLVANLPRLRSAIHPRFGTTSRRGANGRAHFKRGALLSWDFTALGSRDLLALLLGSLFALLLWDRHADAFVAFGAILAADLVANVLHDRLAVFANLRLAFLRLHLPRDISV